MLHQRIAVFGITLADRSDQTDLEKVLYIKCNREDLLAQERIQNGKLLQVGEIKLNILPGLRILAVVFGKRFYLEKVIPLREKTSGAFLRAELECNAAMIPHIGDLIGNGKLGFLRHKISPFREITRIISQKGG